MPPAKVIAPIVMTGRSAAAARRLPDEREPASDAANDALAEVEVLVGDAGAVRR
ncbi:hypothetical protein [Agromyces sp. ZXT2-3]|uniref:hypothetical protein n=1 Tax=Agromyces sp. ZXT2-3 TaxID=3461152 RepID=UPI0040551574